MSKATTRTIKVDDLARVEGEGALYLRVCGDVIQDLKFRIHEPPRFFEALLQGRDYSEAPDITARICGICPIAYIMGATHAMEDALGVTVGTDIRDLRRLVYCGEWIESHVLHAFLLHAPDFLGYEDSISLSKDHPEVVKKALAIKKTGNKILEVIGGRAIHPVNLKVGGVYKAPRKAAMDALAVELETGLKIAIELTEFVSGLTFPDYRYDYTCVSLKHPDEYAITEGGLVSNKGLDIAIADFEKHFDEEHVEHSNALHGVAKETGGAYLTGPIARFNNNFDQLSPRAKKLAKKAKLDGHCDNPFQSIVVRMIETVYAFEEALRLAKVYHPLKVASLDIAPRAGQGFGITEAPRGICYHGYELDKKGLIKHARIMPPTSQNQKQIERDLWGVVEKNLDLSDEELKWRCEQTIRNYDPCISCATHFLKLTIDRE